MQDGIFVLDGVAHAFDMSPANFANERFAQGLNDLQSALFGSQPPGYDLDPASTIRDWTVEDTANILFRETYTDVAIFHPVPIFFYKDGLSGFQKALEATKRWPSRFVGSYCAVDPISPDPVGEFERQFEQLDNPVGLKLYPVGFDSEGMASPWRMDDPKLGFPLYEKCRELGLNNVAIHKSLPLGPAPNGRAFHPEDVEGAALAFPDINFSIVHGGMAFTEETAWLVARFPNIWINMESLNITLMLRPRVLRRDARRNHEHRRRGSDRPDVLGQRSHELPPAPVAGGVHDLPDTRRCARARRHVLRDSAADRRAPSQDPRREPGPVARVRHPGAGRGDQG